MCMVIAEGISGALRQEAHQQKVKQLVDIIDDSGDAIHHVRTQVAWNQQEVMGYHSQWVWCTWNTIIEVWYALQCCD